MPETERPMRREAIAALLIPLGRGGTAVLH